jgi:hypothetical protein
MQPYPPGSGQGCHALAGISLLPLSPKDFYGGCLWLQIQISVKNSSKLFSVV